MWYIESLESLVRKLKTDIRLGLSETEVNRRKEKFGENKLLEKKRENILIRFLKEFNDFMIIILIVAAIISAVISYLDGTNEYVDSIIIIGIVILNSIMGLIQENKAEKSLEALKKISMPSSKVKRNGEIQTIVSTDLVPGDLIILESGCYVPADARIIKSFNLKIEESALTGETVPVLKNEEIVLTKKTPIGDRLNMVFVGTMVISGHGEAIVTETGMNTELGNIAQMIITNKTPETPLQKKLGKIGKKLGTGALILCFLIFIIGILKKVKVSEMFMTSIGLAVAAIPEGLPAIVTIILSISVSQMAKKKAIIRKLPAVETLGSSSVICSDKTGTLTQNKMKVIQVFENNKLNIEINSKNKMILQLAIMCTDSEVINKNGKINIVGEPTEKAIVEAGLKIGENKKELYEKMEKINEISFDSTRKLMTTIHKIGNKYRIITKGAPDVLIKRCINYYNNGTLQNLDKSIQNTLKINNDKMAENALRVLGIAYKDINILPKLINSENIEKELNFVGLIGLIDPPREGVEEAIKTCKNAGIKTVMITGDHIITAKAIAKQLGILKQEDYAITGDELDRIPQKKLEKEITKYSVFARVSPEHKVRIVKAFRSNNSVVAMTGDGVNDAPALKSADIGIAMGQNGTDVAKNASDMILTDDNFITIVEAVKTGRHIYDNIRKAIHFLISTNVGEIVTIFVGLLFGLKSPLLAIQLLWINLITDSFPAIALGLEPIEENIMYKKPRDSKKGLFGDGLWIKIFIEGIMIGLLTLFAFNIGYKLYNIEVGRTMAFVSLGLLELVHSFNVKSDESILNNKMINNKYLIGAFVLGIIMQVIIVTISPISKVFEVTRLNFKQWVYTIGISISPLAIMEIQKRFNEIKFGKVIYKKSVSKT